MKAVDKLSRPEWGGEVVLLPLRTEGGGDSGVERRSMRSGEAIVGAMMAGWRGRIRMLYKWNCKMVDDGLSGSMLRYRDEKLITCAAESEVKYLHGKCQTLGVNLNFEQENSHSEMIIPLDAPFAAWWSAIHSTDHCYPLHLMHLTTCCSHVLTDRYSLFSLHYHQKQRGLHYS